MSMFPPHWPVEPADLKRMCEQVDKILGEYPEPPIRWEVAHDVYAAMCERWPADAPLPNPLAGFAAFTGFYGVPVRINHHLDAGEYGPVYSCRKAR